MARLHFWSISVWRPSTSIRTSTRIDHHKRLQCFKMLSILISPTFLAPVHLLANSTLLGMQLWQSFVMVKVAYLALSPEPFTLLQKRVFPVYFRSQCALIAISAITFPTNGPAGLLREYGHWVPHLVAAITAALNLVLFGPKTSRLMMIKRSQGTLATEE